MKRPCESMTEGRSWPLCLLECVGKGVCGALETYYDFLNWHSTCHTLWRPLEEHLYGEYLLTFLAQCEKRNAEKAFRTVHSSFHRNIWNLRSIVAVHGLVNDLLTLIRAFPGGVAFKRTHEEIRKRLDDVQPPERKGRVLTVVETAVLDRFIRHMRSWYAWEVAFHKLITEKVIMLPLPTPLVCIEPYELRIIPVGLLNFTKGVDEEKFTFTVAHK